jgi:hypothetical protein
MKCIFIFLLSLICITFFGQDTINQTNEKGQKVGYWVTYDDSGKIIKEEYCWAYSKNSTNELSNAQKFLGLVSTTEEVFREYEYCNNTIIYEYNKDGSLYRVHKKGLKNQDEYFYGLHQEVNAAEKDFHFLNRVDSIVFITVELTNVTDQPINLFPVIDFKSTTTEKQIITLPPNQLSKLTFELIVQPIDSAYKLHLKNESVSITYSIYTFGYHITSEDIEKGKEMELGDTAIYYRTGNEALLYLYSANKKKELATYSLALQKTPLDLSSYKKGMYWLCIEDYSTNKKTFCKIRIK